MTAVNSLKGRLAEKAVAGFLQEKGYEICAANYLVPGLGELDLVARCGSQLTVIEVKARNRADQYGGLPSSITPQKLRRMRNTALCYLKENHFMNLDVSFLAALVKIDHLGVVESIELVPIECL